ncbi:MAG: DUF5677 domain-containing protein [Thermoguttaceae bacterium]
MTDDELFAIYANTHNDLTKKLNDVCRESSVTIAIELLLGRLVYAGQSIALLRNHSSHNYAFDGAMILRGMYDTMLQALYILSDPAQQKSRATQYLDYYWIEKHKMLAVCDQSPTYAGQLVSQSKMRASAEPEIEREFQRVRQTYENKNGKLQNNWYKGDLRSLSKSVGLESEYEILQKQLSGAVHSSPFALREPKFFSEKFPMMLFAWRFIFRVSGKFARYTGITPEDIESKLIALSEKNIFGEHSNQL